MAFHFMNRCWDIGTDVTGNLLLYYVTGGRAEGDGER